MTATTKEGDQNILDTENPYEMKLVQAMNYSLSGQGVTLLGSITRSQGEKLLRAGVLRRCNAALVQDLGTRGLEMLDIVPSVPSDRQLEEMCKGMRTDMAGTLRTALAAIAEPAQEGAAEETLETVVANLSALFDAMFGLAARVLVRDGTICVQMQADRLHDEGTMKTVNKMLALEQLKYPFVVEPLPVEKPKR